MLTDAKTNLTEEELVRKAQQGNRIAFSQLYQSYEAKVRSTLYSLCGKEVLDDLVQEVFLKTWQGLPKLRQTNTFSTWLYRISWNVASDQRRRFAQRRGQIQPQTKEELLSPDTPDLMQLHYQDLVQKGLQSLSLDHRAVLVLHDLEDLPQKEISKILAIPLGTVKSRLFHARNALREYLQQEGVVL